MSESQQRRNRELLARAEESESRVMELEALVEREREKLKSECEGCARTSRLEAKVKRLRDFIGEVAQWRELCWEYDADMGQNPRSFADDEEWDLLEEAASRIAAKESEDDGDLALPVKGD